MTDAPTTRRPVTAHDLLRFHLADDPRISPDGRTLAWVRTRLDADRDAYLSEIVLTDLESGAERRLTDRDVASDGSESAPRWSPSGDRIAFLAPGEAAASDDAAPGPAETFLDHGAQLWVAPVTDAGGARGARLTSLRGGAAPASWSPDGATLAFTTLVHPERGLETGPVEPPSDPYERYTRDVLRVTRVGWKSDALGLLGDYVRQLATVPAGGGEVRLPCRTPHDVGAPTWHPDGRRLAIVGNLGENAELERRQTIHLVDLAASDPRPEPLFTLEEMRASDVAFSPDGTRIAVCGHDDPKRGHYGFQRLWIVDVASGEGRCVSREHDVSFGDYSRNQDLRRTGGADGPRWLPDGSAILLLANRHGTVHVERFDLEDGSLTPLTDGRRVVSAFTMDDAGRRLALRITDGATPGELFTLDVSETGAQPRRRTGVNDDLLQELDLPEPELFVSRSGDAEVAGWIHWPPNRTPGQRIPVVLYTGGGPGGMRAEVFVHEFHLYAANGYAVLNCNARGNYGYGEAFSDAPRGWWGGVDYEDNMAFLHDALAAHPELDGDRVGVAGGSYGGFMASWIAARHPELKAAVVDRTLFNRYAFSGTSDIGILLDLIEFEGRYPWEAPDRYLEVSPIAYVGDVDVPTLVVHSALDHRCPVDQGEQLYMALRVRGVPTELIRFPNETHELSRNGRPNHRLYRLERYLAWFDRWL